MEATEAATYERRAVGENGELLEREMFDIGSIEGGRSVALKIVNFDKDGQPSGTTKVTWEQGDMAPARIVDAAIHFGGSAASIETAGPLLLYPRDVDARRTLEDVELKIKILKGLMRLLGTRTKIVVSAREAEPMPLPSSSPGSERADQSPYRITSRIVARVFVLAIPVKRVEFDTEECVVPSIGLIRHEIKLEDGTRAIMERVASSGAPSELAEARRACGRESAAVDTNVGVDPSVPIDTSAAADRAAGTELPSPAL